MPPGYLMAHPENRRPPRLGNPGGGQPIWPLLALLLLTVTAPSICLLWFMNQAARNERLAVRQKLVQLYEQHMATRRAALDAFWSNRIESLSTVVAGESHGRRFARLVIDGAAESAVLYDAEGKLAYPRLPARPTHSTLQRQAAWEAAEQLEFRQHDPATAADRYAAMAESPAPAGGAAMALRAEMRCRFKSGQTGEALRILEQLDAPELRVATDESGRLIAPDAQLLAIRCLDPARRTGLVRTLAARLNDYQSQALPSAQRVFLMEQVRQLDASLVFPTLVAEKLALQYVGNPPAPPRPPVLAQAGAVWQLPGRDFRTVGLYSTTYITNALARIGADPAALPGTAMALTLKSAAPAPAPFLTASAGARMPDWELRFFLQGPDPFAEAAARQANLYAWVAVLVILVIFISALLLTRYLVRQVRLTRLKNNFVATVTHELKTPLAAIRLLVDTLLAGRVDDPQATREYLAMIARENERLTRLIDNFLSFSRMERNKPSFEFQEITADAIVQSAAASVAGRLAAAGFRLQVETNPALPRLTGHHDALVTVLINLLDNAFKYSGAARDIHLRARPTAAGVVFEVQDHGIGLSAREIRRIFKPFYQVDQSLSRTTGGCGLGLSIVDFIVRAHHGRIAITSRPGQGSLFQVIIPADPDRQSAEAMP